MKLTFKMTGEEYYLGVKYRRSKGDSLSRRVLLLVVLFNCAAALLVGVLLDIMAGAVTIIICMAAFVFLLLFMQKKSIIQEYNFSRTLSGENTVRLYGEGIELFNSYEKIYTPWQSVFAVKETDKALIILPTYRKGVFVINKEKYKSPELERITDALRRNVRFEKGRV